MWALMAYVHAEFRENRSKDELGWKGASTRTQTARRMILNTRIFPF
jgi:hypothetical protein